MTEDVRRRSDLKVRIHRGAHEVGGSCIELECGGARLVLDIGRPIGAAPGTDVPLPPVAGLDGCDPSLLGVVLSHAHLDHCGLMDQVAPSVPVFIGEAAQRILDTAHFFTGASPRIRATGFLRHRVPFALGPFRITPFLSDHSAFDAYSLLVEAGGRRLFYTGDIRGHGRKAGIFEELLRRPPPVDVLLMEGTHVRSHADGTNRGSSERDVEDSSVELCRAAPEMVLALYSPQNIDRLVTLFRTALRSGRELVMDLYAASIAEATGRHSIPRAGWERVRVYLPRAQRTRIVRERAFWRTDAVRSRRIFPEELAARRGELIMTFRSSMASELALAGCLPGARAIWSMWPGYLQQPSALDLQDFLASHAIPLAVHHASGHAFIPDLQRLARAIDPERIVPIHSFGGDHFAHYFPRVDRQHDGAWWQV